MNAPGDGPTLWLTDSTSAAKINDQKVIYFIMTPPTLKRSKKRRWLRRKQARPGEILDAALDLFVERGFSATKLEDVASCAGVSKGTLYRYYDSKEALFRAVITQVLVPEVERVEQQVKSFKGPRSELIRLVFHGWWARVADSRLSGIPKLMVSEASNFPEFGKLFVDKVVRRVRRIFMRIMQTGIDCGEFRDCDLHIAARVLIAPMVYAAILQRSLSPYDEPYDVPTFLDFHLELFLAGLAAKPGTDEAIKK